MEKFLLKLQQLVASGNSQISLHGMDEIEADDISLLEILEKFGSCQIVEYYPDYHKGPCILVLQFLNKSEPVHVLWGTSSNNPEMATLITAYRPNTEKWTNNYLNRRAP